MPRRSVMALSVIKAMSLKNEEKELSEKEVHDQNGDRAGDDGTCGRASDAVRAAAGAEAVVAADERDREAEEERLADAGREVVVLHGGDDAAHVEVRGDVQADDGDDQAAEDAEGHRDDGEEREH